MNSEQAAIREKIDIKKESIQLAWIELAESMPTLSGQERYVKKSAIKGEVAELAELIDALDAATPAPHK